MIILFFPQRQLPASANSFKFKVSSSLELKDSAVNRYGKPLKLEQLWNETFTTAVVVIRNDSILYEWYKEDFPSNKKMLSFSVAKSITALAVGCAIDEGLIGSLQDPIIKYIPELPSGKGFEAITIQHLMDMKSGINFRENYSNPFSPVIQLYYGKKYLSILSKLRMRTEPGKEFRYQNGDTQLLGRILQVVLSSKGKSITTYLDEKIWSKLGTEFDAGFNYFDKDGTEKTFCCFSACARDYAKIGRLMLNKGNWNGEQLFSKSWAEEILRFNGNSWYGKSYHNQWWQTGEKYSYADGHLGQYIFLDKTKNIIVVRLGTERKNFQWIPFFKDLCEDL